MDKTTGRTYSRLLLTVGLGCVIALVAACGGSKPTTIATPQLNADSAAAAEQARQAEAERQAREEAERKAREDAERQAREEAERARQHTADSLAAVARGADEMRATLATMIQFDFDKSKIMTGDVAVLDQKVAILTANPDIKIRVAGHCDERGSAEYNIALGNRRAATAKQYLVKHGIDAGRIATISYGEERPLDPGHDEAAWAKNRRDEFEIVSGGVALRQP